jgi:hypothetical protein
MNFLFYGHTWFTVARIWDGGPYTRGSVVAIVEFLLLISVRPERDWIRPSFKAMHDFPVIAAAGQRLFWPWFLCHAAVNSSHLSSWVFRFIIMTDWRINCLMANQIRSHRSCWPRCLRRGSAASRWLGLRVRIPLGVWMSVCCDCCVLWNKGPCDGPISCLEKFYRVCVCVCDEVQK